MNDQNPIKKLLTWIWNQVNNIDPAAANERGLEGLISLIKQEQDRRMLFVTPLRNGLMFSGDIDAINRVLERLTNLNLADSVEPDRHREGPYKGQAYIRVRLEEDIARKCFAALDFDYDQLMEILGNDAQISHPGFEQPQEWSLHDDESIRTDFMPPKPWSPDNDNNEGGNLIP